jgi:hypothetical protein
MDVHGPSADPQVGARAELKGAVIPRPPPAAYLSDFDTADHGAAPRLLPPTLFSGEEAADDGVQRHDLLPVLGAPPPSRLRLPEFSSSDGMVLANAVPAGRLSPAPPPPDSNYGALLSGQAPPRLRQPQAGPSIFSNDGAVEATILRRADADPHGFAAAAAPTRESERYATADGHPSSGVYVTI